MEANFLQQRTALAVALCRGGYIRTEAVRKSFLKVRRELFVRQVGAYEDTPLPIGHGQTISAPHMVAEMTELCEPRKNHVVLEIGAGSGYQAAILSGLVKRVVSLEIVPELCMCAEENLKKSRIQNVTLVCGGLGKIPARRYDTILFSCAAPSFPKHVLPFLKNRGRLIVPVGRGTQELFRVRKRGRRMDTEKHGYCSFVPLVEK